MILYDLNISQNVSSNKMIHIILTLVFYFFFEKAIPIVLFFKVLSNRFNHVDKFLTSP